MSPPTIYQLKPAFQKLLRPIVARLAEWQVTPNQVTVSGIGLSGLAGASLLWGIGAAHRWPFFVIPAALFCRMALNAIDGMLAREHDLKTPLGGILNELGDVVSDAALYLPFALMPGRSAPAVVLVVILAILTEMTGVLAIANGQSRSYAGPMGKSDRAFVFGLVSLLLGFGLTPGLWLELVWIGLMVLLVGTVFNRIKASIPRQG